MSMTSMCITGERIKFQRTAELLFVEIYYFSLISSASYAVMLIPVSFSIIVTVALELLIVPDVGQRCYPLCGAFVPWVRFLTPDNSSVIS